MTLSTVQTLAMAITFLCMMALMLVYWYQAAIFSSIRYKSATRSLLLASILLLTSILTMRWVESRHFPLSNLYESLVFLSWSFLMSQWLLQHKSRPFSPISAERRRDRSFTNPTASSPLVTMTEADGGEHTAYSIASFGGSQDGKDAVDLTSLIGVVLSPLALLTYGFAFLKLPKELQQATALLPALQSNWLMMHVTIMILSYAALIGGSILSMAFLLVAQIDACTPFEKQQRAPSRLTTQQNGTTSHLTHIAGVEHSSTPADGAGAVLDEPPSPARLLFEGSPISTSHHSHLANRLDNLSYRLLGLGFPLLTIGILSGAVWANEAWGSYWSWDPKETWALITWLVFAIYLHTRITKGWNGQRPAVIATIGFFTVWFCYLGVNLLGTGLHSYGWFSRPG